MPKLFDYINDLSHKKEHLIRQDPENIKGYNPFIINRALSMSRETLHAANEVNQMAGLSKEMQYDFLFYVIPKRFRKYKWPKKVDNKSLSIIKRYCNVSYPKALEYMKFFTEEHIAMMEDYYREGGVTTKPRKTKRKRK